MSLLHLDSAGDHLAHIESRQHDRQKSDRSEDGEPASHVVRNDKCLVAFLCGEGLEGALVSIGDGDNPFGSVFVGLLDVFLDNPERDPTAGSVVVPDLEITTVTTFLSATRSISSARYSSERLLPAKTTSGASFAPPSCLAKLWESASMAQRAPR